MQKTSAAPNKYPFVSINTWRWPFSFIYTYTLVLDLPRSSIPSLKNRLAFKEKRKKKECVASDCTTMCEVSCSLSSRSVLTRLLSWWYWEHSAATIGLSVQGDSLGVWFTCSMSPMMIILCDQNPLIHVHISAEIPNTTWIDTYTSKKI